MWTVDKLREAVELRGETLPVNRTINEALLAFERLNGRTEENYQKARAEREMNRILDTYDGPFPAKRSDEYPGLTELRAYAEDRAKMRDAEADKAAETAKADAKQEAKPERALTLEQVQDAYVADLEREEDDDHEDERAR